MADEQREFWSKVAHKYDQVVDLQIGSSTRSMARNRLAKEGRLGNLVEFGCGTGFFTRVLSGIADSVVATDLSPGMLALAKDQVKAANVSFQVEDCQKTSLPSRAFDAGFMGLVIHFTDPGETLSEMRRILKPGGTLIIVNPDSRALTGLDRLRCRIRIVYHGIVRYRTKPPKGLGKGGRTETQLCDLLRKSGFEIVSTERILDTSRSSNIPVDYIKTVSI